MVPIKNTEDIKIDKSLNWKLAKVINLDKLLAKIQIEDQEIAAEMDLAVRPVPRLMPVS